MVKGHSIGRNTLNNHKCISEWRQKNVANVK